MVGPRNDALPGERSAGPGAPASDGDASDRPGWTIAASPDVYDALPKVELHCHVEGTIRPSTVVELARAAGRTLPVDDPRDLYRYTSLDSFLAVFWLV